MPTVRTRLRACPRWTRTLPAALLALGLALPGAVAEAQGQSCSVDNMSGLWKLVAEQGAEASTQPVEEFLEVKSGLLFWLTRPQGGERTRTRHKLFFIGSTLDVRPPLAKAPLVQKCTRTGRRLVLLTSSVDASGTVHRGRLVFQKTG